MLLSPHTMEYNRECVMTKGTDWPPPKQKYGVRMKGMQLIRSGLTHMKQGNHINFKRMLLSMHILSDVRLTLTYTSCFFPTALGGSIYTTMIIVRGMVRDFKIGHNSIHFTTSPQFNSSNYNTTTSLGTKTQCETGFTITLSCQ